MTKFQFKHTPSTLHPGEFVYGSYDVYFDGIRLGAVRKGPASTGYFNSWQYRAAGYTCGASSRQDAAEQLLRRVKSDLTAG